MRQSIAPDIAISYTPFDFQQNIQQKERLWNTKKKKSECLQLENIWSVSEGELICPYKETKHERR